MVENAVGKLDVFQIINVPVGATVNEPVPVPVKVYVLTSSVPLIIRLLAPAAAVRVTVFPFCMVTSPSVLSGVVVAAIHESVPVNDCCQVEVAFQLPEVIDRKNFVQEAFIGVVFENPEFNVGRRFLGLQFWS